MKTVELSQKDKLAEIFSRHKIIFAAIFGSRAKGIAKKNSDYDLLVEFDSKFDYSLFDLVDAKDDLEALLKRHVDLVTVPALDPLMKDEVFKTMKVFYDTRKR